MYKTGIILGFDFGTKHLGVAVGNLTTHTARALTTLSMNDGKAIWPQLDELVNKWVPDVMIVGMPLSLEGEEQTITQRTREFITSLEQRYAKPIYTVDERFSTKSAKEELFATGGYKALQKSAIDSKSAQLILESWLNSQNGEL